MLPPSIWRRQPSFVVPTANLSNPLTRDLVALFCPIATNGYYDASRYRNHAWATYFGTPVRSRDGLGVSYTGGGFISALSSPPTFSLSNGGFSVALWVRLNASPNSYGGLLGREDPGATGQDWEFDHRGTSQTLVFAKSGAELHNANYLVSDGLWHLWVFTCTGLGASTWYVDGASVSTNTGVAIQSASGRFALNAKTLSTDSSNSQLADVAIWNRVLAANEVQIISNNFWQLYRSPSRRIFALTAAAGSAASSFSGRAGLAGANADRKAGLSSTAAKAGAIATDAAKKSTSAGLTAIASALGTISDRKAATAGISAISGLLGALSTTTPGTSDFHAIAGALVNITHATARIATIQAKAGTTGQAAAIHKATRSLQAIAGMVATVSKSGPEVHSSTIAGIAGAAAAVAKTTARIAALAAKAGLLGTDTAKTIRAAQTAALAGLRVAVLGVNGEAISALNTCAVSDTALYTCTLSRSAYSCTLSEAIVQ